MWNSILVSWYIWVPVYVNTVCMHVIVWLACWYLCATSGWWFGGWIGIGENTVWGGKYGFRDETCVNIHSNFVMYCTYRYSNVTNFLAKEDLSGSDGLSQKWERALEDVHMFVYMMLNSDTLCVMFLVLDTGNTTRGGEGAELQNVQQMTILGESDFAR